jgi:hypothetical protein
MKKLSLNCNYCSVDEVSIAIIGHGNCSRYDRLHVYIIVIGLVELLLF